MKLEKKTLIIAGKKIKSKPQSKGVQELWKLKT